MKILITLCARGGSKGIPGKNIRELSGKPLIAYSIDHAVAFLAKNNNGRIALSTDSDEIRDVVQAYGLVTEYRRPERLATDVAGKIDAIADVLEFHERHDNSVYDFILDLDITSPLRSLEDLEAGLKLLQENEKALNIFSVSPAARNPYFNMVEKNDDGFFQLVKKDQTFLSRQTAPEVYDMNASFYIYKREFFSKGFRSAVNDLSLAYVMDHVCFDLDEPVDFEFMEYLLNNKKLDFIL